MAESIVGNAIKRAFDKWFSELKGLDKLFLEEVQVAADEGDWGGIPEDFYDGSIDPGKLEAYVLDELNLLLDIVEITVKFPKTQIEKK
jgi:hypothetical protein